MKESIYLLIVHINSRISQIESDPRIVSGLFRKTIVSIVDSFLKEATNMEELDIKINKLNTLHRGSG